ncbi:MAG: hypothetical protein HRT40_06380 [Campylobacteraceae bacterium]|nr:hypothetical protein [Campylobacteraceae bacterium]
MIIVVVVGIGAHFIFNAIENEFHITKKLIKALDEYINNPNKIIGESIFDYKTKELNNNFGLSSL